MSYSNSKYGLIRRAIIDLEDDVGSTGVSAGGISVPRKSKIYKFGVIPTGAAAVCSTTTTFVLETEAGTVLATFVPGKEDLTVKPATGEPFTATTITANNTLKVNITEAGSSGSVNYYVDLKEQFDASVDTDDALV